MPPETDGPIAANGSSAQRRLEALITSGGTGGPGDDAAAHAVLLREYAAVRERPGVRCVLLRGPGGIGKSTVVAHLLADPHLTGCATLTGRANAFDGGVPYAVFADALSRLRGQTADAELRARIDATLDALDVTTACGPTPDASVPRVSLDSIVGRTQALLMALARPGTDTAVVCALEDMNVADGESIALFGRLCRQSAALPVLFVLTLRPGYDSTRALERFIAALAADDRATVVDLEPLTSTRTAALIEGLVGRAPDATLVESVQRASGGNPFFATEAVRQLSRIGAGSGGEVPTRPSRNPSSAGPEPGAMAHDVLDRFFDPGSDEERLAQVLSTLRLFTLPALPIVACVAGLGDEAAAESLDRLLSRGLLVPGRGPAIGFAHPILRDTLYAAIGAGRRQLFHGEIARALLARRDSGEAVDPFELARHLQGSSAAGSPVALDAAEAAAEAAAAGAPLVAARWFGQAADGHAVADPQRLRLRGRQIVALLLGGDLSSAAVACDTALAELDGASAPDAFAEPVANVYWLSERFADALAITARAAGSGAAQDAGPPLGMAALRAQLLAQLGDDHAGDARAGRTHTGGAGAVADLDVDVAELRRRALAQAARVGELTVLEAMSLIGTLVQLSYQAELLGLDGRRVELEGALRVVTIRAPAAVRAEVHNLFARQAAVRGDVAVLDAELERVLELHGSEVRNGVGTGEFATVLGYWLRGQWGHALDYVEARTADFDLAGGQARAYPLRALASTICTDRGDLVGATKHLRDLTSVSALVAPLIALARAQIHYQTGDLDAAATVLTDQLAIAVRRGHLPFSTKMSDLLVWVELKRGRDPAALDVAQLGLDFVRGADSALLQIWADRGLAEATGDAELAARTRDRAQAAGLPVEQARSALQCARLGGEVDSNLRAAYAGFDAAGALIWRQTAARLMRERGLAIPRRKRRGAGLAMMEIQLAGLVAQGLSNRQIAGRLSYSEKTVESYLSRLYVKTACAGRAELMRAYLDGSLRTTE